MGADGLLDPTTASGLPLSRARRIGLQSADRNLISLMESENKGRSSYVIVLTKCDKVGAAKVGGEAPSGARAFGPGSGPDSEPGNGVVVQLGVRWRIVVAGRD